MRGTRRPNDPLMREKWRAHNPLVREGATMTRPAGARKVDGKCTIRGGEKVQRANLLRRTGLRRLMRKRRDYRIDGGHRPIQEYAQHVRVGVTLSTTGPQASGITLDRAGALSWDLLVMRTASWPQSRCVSSASAVRWDSPGMEPLWSTQVVPYTCMEGR